MKNILVTIFVLAIFVLAIFVLSGCGSDFQIIESHLQTESIIFKGDRISATNVYGTLTITADKNNKRFLTLSGQDRTLSWMGDTVSVKLSKNNKVKFTGILGESMYGRLSCDANIKKIRYENGRGPTRVEMEEAQLHFETLETAEELFRIWDNAYDKEHNLHVWSNDGLYVNWSHVHPEYWIIPKKSYLSIQLFQTYVDGKMPSDLPGTQNEKIKVEYLTDEQVQKIKKSINWF